MKLNELTKVPGSTKEAKRIGRKDTVLEATASR